MDLSAGARRVLTARFIPQADRLVRDLILEGGGNAGNIRQAGHWADMRVGDVAEAAASKNRGAKRAIKILKDASRLGEEH